MVDWRRSARDDRLYVREREWESAATWWLWIDLSRSMHFTSSLALASKRDRAVVLGLALADLLVRSGERVGLLGLTAPIQSRTIINRLSDVLAPLADAADEDLPSGPAPGPRDRLILIGDCILAHETARERIARLSERGALGTLLQLRDPVETLFPFSGETEFLGPEDGLRWTVGEAADMAEAYKNRLQAHEVALRQACHSRGWTFMSLTTDRPASEALLTLAMRLTGGAAGG